MLNFYQWVKIQDMYLLKECFFPYLFFYKLHVLFTSNNWYKLLMIKLVLTVIFFWLKSFS